MKNILFFIQNLAQAQLFYQLYKQVYDQEIIDIILLINYSKYGGYQMILLNNGEIISNLKEFNNLNKITSIDDNIKVIGAEITKLFNDDQRKIDIILTFSIDNKENEVVLEKMKEKLMDVFNNENDKKNINIIKTDLQFNIDLQINSHVFYFDN